MHKLSWILAGSISLLLLAGCGKKKKQVSLSGDEPVTTPEFIESFRPLQLPYYYADSTLRRTKKENDSLRISQKVFAGVIPDSVLTKIYGKGTKPKIYAMGKIAGPAKEIYLLVKTVSGEKKAVFLLGFDKEQKFAASLAALRPDLDASTNQTFTIDKRYNIGKTVLRRNKNGSMSEGKDVYAFNADAKAFILVMTDALEDKPTELINPIDTLARTQKWTADYTNGKMNLVSIRDGRRSSELRFFIHFEKGGDCSGELKGEADITSPNTAEYRQDGDPCKLKFTFTSSSVTLTEIEGCGSYRPLNCSFNASFAKKREIKNKQTSVKKKKK